MPAGIVTLSACLLMWNGTVALRRYAGVAAGVILKNVAVGTEAPSSGCVSISNMTDQRMARRRKNAATIAMSS